MARTASAEDPARLLVDLDLDDEQQLLLDSTRGFLARHYPLEAIRPVLEAERGLDPGAWRHAAEMGWIATLAPEEMGGLRAGPAEASVVAAELGRGLNWLPFLGSALSAAALATSARPGTVAAELLARLAAGEATAAWCGPEPAGGEWGPETVRAEARAERDRYRIEGIKRLAADADLASDLVVTARLDGRLTDFAVPATASGVEIVPARTLDLTRGFPTVRLTGVEVGAERIVGEPGAAEEGFARCSELGTVLTCADATGAAERLLEMTVAYAKERVAFGRPIASYQAVKHKCADMLLAVEASRAATRYAALTVAASAPDRARAVAVAGCCVAERAPALAGEALQIHGGIGFTWEHDLHLFLRRIETDAALFGDAARHRDRLAGLTL